jgi:hypothetical protein
MHIDIKILILILSTGRAIKSFLKGITFAEIVIACSRKDTNSVFLFDQPKNLEAKSTFFLQTDHKHFRSH